VMFRTRYGKIGKDLAGPRRECFKRRLIVEYGRLRGWFLKQPRGGRQKGGNTGRPYLKSGLVAYPASNDKSISKEQGKWACDKAKTRQLLKVSRGGNNTSQPGTNGKKNPSKKVNQEGEPV